MCSKRDVLELATLRYNLFFYYFTECFFLKALKQCYREHRLDCYWQSSAPSVPGWLNSIILTSVEIILNCLTLTAIVFLICNYVFHFFKSFYFYKIRFLCFAFLMKNIPGFLKTQFYHCFVCLNY